MNVRRNGRLRRTLAWGIAALSILGSASVAQAQSYSRSNIGTGMTSVAQDPSATVLFDGVNAIGFSMDDATVGVTIPFPFEFFGNTVTDATVSTNGFVTFDPFTSSGWQNRNLGTTSAPNNYVAPFWDDLIIREGSSSRIVTKLEGSSPNRVFIIEFSNLARRGTTVDNVSGQVRLFEGSNNIELIYDGAQSWNNVSATMGIENATGDFGVGAMNMDSTNSTPPSENVRFEPVTTGIDLVVNSQSLSAPNALPGDSLNVTRTLANNGAASSGAFSVGVYLSSDQTIDTNDTLIGSFTVNDIAAAGTDGPSDVNVTIPANTPLGNYFIGLVVDTNNDVAEINENNNASSGTPFLVGMLPDMAAQSLSTNQTTVRGGDNLTFTREIANISSSAAPSFRVEVFLSTNTTITRIDTLIEDFTFSNGLASAGTDNSTITVTVPKNLPAGDYYLGMLIDEDDNIDEDDETNNMTVNFTPITVTQPDVDLDAVAISTQASYAQAGGVLTVTRTITNNGTEDIGAFKVETYLSTNNIISTADTLIDDFTVPGGLAAGATDTVTVDITLPTSILSGTYYVGMLLDDDDQHAETDEYNNDGVTPNPITVYVPVQGIDITADQLELANHNVAAGSVVAATRTFRNAGTQDASTPLRVSFYLSTDQNIDPAADTLLQSINLSSMSAGAVDGPSSTLLSIPPGTPAGDYYIGMVVDDLGSVNEADENNNKTIDFTPLTIGQVPGDVNGDGDVNIFDVQACANQMAGRTAKTPEGDVNKDGDVDMVDVQLTVNTALSAAP